MAPFGIDIPSISSLKASATSSLSSMLPGEAAAAASKLGGITASGWRGQLKPPSFRGVPFYVDSDDEEGGRRAVPHEFLGRDMPFTEDLGKKAGMYTVECYVLGPDYMAKRDALIAACNAEGPGALIVPWMPERKVVCTGMRKRESAKAGGMARFSLTFTEAGQETAPTGAVLPGVLSGVKADGLMDVLGSLLDGKINFSGLPLPVAVDTLQAFQDFAASVSGITSIVQFGADIPGALKALTDISLTDFVSFLPSSLLSPLFLLSSSYSTLVSLFGSSSSGSSRNTSGRSSALTSRVSALLTLASNSPAVAVPTMAGTVRTAQAANRAALAQYQRAAAVTEAARTAALVQPASKQEAAELRTQIVDAFDTVLETTTDETAFAALIDLRTSTVQALAASAGTAPEVSTVQSIAVLPALALAQRYVVSPGYGTDATTAETELLKRNRVRHPGFVPPGDLEVLRAL